jgi:hypothetical protein
VVGDAYISTTLNIGSLNISGSVDVAILKHDNGIALQTSDGSLTYGVFTPAGANFKELIIQDKIVIPDNGLAISKINGLVAGLSSKQDKLNSSSNINIDELNCGKTIINASSSSSSQFITCEIGSSFSYFQYSHGHHIDTYSRDDNSGKALNINYYNNSGVRIGNSNGKLGINCNPNNFPFECVGSGKFSGSLSANNFVTTSDQRIKENVQNISLHDCLRLIKTVHPKTYNRIDMDGASRIGYIAQDLDKELKDNYRCIMGSSEDSNGSLLALDYSRMVVILHGALLNALNRIEVLESKQ